MIKTPICDLLDIEHPIALGGMGSATSPALVAAVSRAGGLGALGCHYLTPEQSPRADDRHPPRDQQAVRAEFPGVRHA